MFTMGPPLWGGASDPYFLYVKSLLHFEDANGTTIPVDKIAGVTWLNSNTSRALVSTTDAKFGNSSMARPLGNGTAGGLYTTSLSAPAGSFTAEFFIKFSSTGAPDSRFFMIGDGSFGYVVLTMSAGNFAMGVSAAPVASLTAVSTGVWYHIAVSFDGATVRMFVNGALAVSVASVAPVLAPFVISPGCAYGLNADETNHYLDDFRYTDGIARYTGAFTPPSSSFPDA